ncbi:uncharacterized protein LOC143821114 [Paroedura picta]|uniref:uncharacterized protein LOC143821114 n=1 Tax=Paroedura picta TaxID=143630 RepID=UPI004056DB25
MATYKFLSGENATAWSYFRQRREHQTKQKKASLPDNFPRTGSCCIYSDYWRPLWEKAINKESGSRSLHGLIPCNGMSLFSASLGILMIAEDEIYCISLSH